MITRWAYRRGTTVVVNITLKNKLSAPPQVRYSFEEVRRGIFVYKLILPMKSYLKLLTQAMPLVGGWIFETDLYRCYSCNKQFGNIVKNSTSALFLKTVVAISSWF